MKKKSKRHLIDRFFLWINYVVCLALLVSYLAPITDPKKIWIIAFFGLAYPPLLVANLILVLYWILRKKWFALISVAGILFGLNILERNIGFHKGGDHAHSPHEEAIRVMTYNVHDFKKYGSNKDISTKHEILELIKDEQPDIIGFQEFYTRKRGQYAMIDSIKKLTGDNNYYFEVVDSNADEEIGLAIFSKYPILSKGLIRLSDVRNSGNQCLYIDVKKNGKSFRIYSLHLQSIKFETQDYKYLDTVSKSGKTDLSSTLRLGGKLKRAFMRRSEQVALVKAHAAQCPYPYIISGDFNDTPSSYAVSRMAKGLKNAFCEKGFGLGRTYNGSFPNYQIDYVMTNKQFNVLSYHIIEKKLSDHYPVCVDVALK